MVSKTDLCKVNLLIYGMKYSINKSVQWQRQLNCPKAKALQGHNSKEKAKVLISDDFHTQPSAKSIVLQHEQNPLEFPLKRQKSLNEDTKCLKRRNRTCQLSAIQCT